MNARVRERELTEFVKSVASILKGRGEKKIVVRLRKPEIDFLLSRGVLTRIAAPDEKTRYYYDGIQVEKV